MNYSFIGYIGVFLVIVLVGFIIVRKIKKNQQQKSNDTQAENSIKVIGKWVQLSIFDTKTNLPNVLYIQKSGITLMQLIQNKDSSRFRIKLTLKNGQVVYTDPVLTELEALQQLNSILWLSEYGKPK